MMNSRFKCIGICSCGTNEKFIGGKWSYCSEKSMLILAMGAFHYSTILLVGSVLTLLSVSLLGTVYFKPYRSDFENEAELVSVLSQKPCIFTVPFLSILTSQMLHFLILLKKLIFLFG